MLPRHKPKKSIKKEIWKKTNGICAHCGRRVSERNKTIDHFVPKVSGGTNDKRNLMPLCKYCNTVKSFNMVNPEDYYIYSPRKYINECIIYKSQFNTFQNDLYLNYILEEVNYEPT